MLFKKKPYIFDPDICFYKEDVPTFLQGYNEVLSAEGYEPMVASCKDRSIFKIIDAAPHPIIKVSSLKSTYDVPTRSRVRFPRGALVIEIITVNPDIPWNWRNIGMCGVEEVKVSNVIHFTDKFLQGVCGQYFKYLNGSEAIPECLYVFRAVTKNLSGIKNNAQEKKESFRWQNLWEDLLPAPVPV